jgi:hypothetical protein
MAGDGWTTFGTPGSYTNNFNNPSGIFVNNSTFQIYIADTGNSRIVRIDDMTGTNWAAGGGAGPFAYGLQYPQGIFVH